MTRMTRRITMVCAATALAGASALAGVQSAGGAVSASAPTGTAGPAHHKRTVPVRLLALNDYHGNLEPASGSGGRAVDETGATVPAGGAVYVATHLKALRDRNTLTVAQGDNIGASPLISAAYHDEPTVDFLGKVGVTASAVGNHEFDEGMAELERIQHGGCHPVDGCSPAGKWKGAKFDYLAANVLKARTGRPVLAPYTIRRINGVKIGFIGVVTKTTPTIVTADGIKGLKFIDEVEGANRAARSLRKQGVHAMVLLVHEGDQVTSAQNKPDDCNTIVGAGSYIAKNADPDIDMVLSGHTHQQYVCSVTDPKGKPRMFSQGLSFGRIITQVDFQVDRRSRDVVRSSVMADNHVITRDVTPDPEIAAFVQQWKDRVAPVANKPIGKITADLNRVASPTGETPLGDVIADAQLETVKNEGAQIALMNPGGVRADLTYAASGAEGDGVVTYGEAFSVQPFNNLVGVVSLTGAQLDKLLEQQWQPQANGSVIERILQPSATLHYTMDKSQPIGQRISNITVNGAAVEDTTSYKVAANNFLLGGGDGFTTFTEGTGQVLGPIDLDGFVAYMSAHSPVAPPALNRISAP